MPDFKITCSTVLLEILFPNRSYMFILLGVWGFCMHFPSKNRFQECINHLKKKKRKNPNQIHTYNNPNLAL